VNDPQPLGPSPSWYVACDSRRLGRSPLARTVCGRPVVLFRAATGDPVALADRCPHRNMPLSAGRMVGDELECAYHGWRFDQTGRCARIPGRVDDGPTGRHVPRYRVAERDGWVWLWTEPDSDDAPEPPRPIPDELHGSICLHIERTFAGRLSDVAENILDVPHTAFLHRGLFRRATGAEVTAVVRRRRTAVEAEFIGEPRPSGLIARLLAPRATHVEHIDRFQLPSITQVLYRLGGDAHLAATSALTPVDGRSTRLHGRLDVRAPLPALVVKAVLAPLSLWILGQDGRALERQRDNMLRFGGPRYSSTEVDLLGPEIVRLLERAQAGELIDPEPPTEREIRLRL